ncbi:MAG: DHH family phosphoesterase [Bacteroidales bacterium]|nr:DHH family phosphoesterase [Bacteroidales bacterium]
MGENSIRTLDGLIEAAERITIAVHTHPDGDAAGSGAALLSYLRERRGKDAVLLLPDPLPDSLTFVLPRDGVMVYEEAPETACGRIAASDLLFGLDFNAFDRTGGAEIPLRESRAEKVLFDHHLSPDRAAFDLVFSRTEVSSACEVLFDTLLALPDIAGDAGKLPAACTYALMTGMTTDTNNFANSVFPGTLRMASALLAAGTDRDDILARLYNRYRENRFRLMGYLLSEVLRITPEGVAYMILRKEDQLRFNMRQGETEGFVNLPLGIDRVRMSLFLTEQEDHFRVSVRSKKGTSANRMAASRFHGGGHELAAGGKLYFPADIPGPDDAQAYILKGIEGFFEG